MTPLARAVLAAMHARFGEEDGTVWGVATLTPDLVRRILVATPDADTGSAEYRAFCEAYAADMEAGCWLPTGDSVVLSSRGTAVDGRARLIAASMTGKPLTTLVVIGIKPELRSRMDLRYTHTPAPRREVQRGMDRTLALAVSFSEAGDGRPAAGEDGHATLARSHAYADGVPESGGMTRATVAAFHWMAAGQNARLADSFVDVLVVPEASPLSPPARIAANPGRFAKLTPRQSLCVLAGAWNCYLDGSPFDIACATALARKSESLLHGLARARAEQPLENGRGLHSSVALHFSVAFETITPKIAAALLKTSPGRPEPSTDIESDLRRGLWAGANGQTIKIGPNGELLDGRRRLRAVVRTGIPIRVLVARGVDPRARPKMNLGRRGGLGFALQSRSESNPHDVPAALRALLRLEHRDIGYRPTMAELTDAFGRWPQVIEATRVTKKCKPFLRQSVSVPCNVLMMQQDEAGAREFFSRLRAYHDGGDVPTAIADFYDAVETRLKVLTAKDQFSQIEALMSAWETWRHGGARPVAMRSKADRVAPEPSPRAGGSRCGERQRPEPGHRAGA